MLVRFPSPVRADLDGDFAVEALQKVQQFVSREPAVMTVHQMGHLRLRDTEKRRDRKHKSSGRLLSKGLRAAAAPAPAPPTPERAGARVVRGRPPAVKPMGVDEAALAMESSGQEVLVFRDAANERVSVLYRRRDGDLGLIVPEC